MWKAQTIVTGFALAIVGAMVPITIPQPAAADIHLFKQMDIGFFSVGGRATYYDPQEGQSRWFGGAQVRVNPFRYLSFEGSADYRRQDTEGTRVHTYPVQVSALIYPLGHTRLAPFLLGGEDGTTPRSKDRVISTTRKIDSASMLEEGSSFSSATTSQSTAPIGTFGWKMFGLKTRTSKTKISTTTAI
jgi:hypothetical protein